ncbi:carbohydrate ABC transporter permease [Dactylosporangium matsuzakiense]|uniref:ABC transporter permease n=1 Tax=Dactylosporangium matsuzakiense TaxID=53360 RepID=A0A9W6NQE6_9ACTN|nr:carbohydrate ABC transporter permease [Dactylosporangium matsuzakiense]UWZ47489.1 carbohydrate ABC transporter permease [Dactylosporangium matsuzakiense]GLL05248.1 ABC transporter permease [Dactylosporangium matsuzakiense]
MKTDVHRLLPRWMQGTIITLLGLFVATPVLYMLFASVNDDLAVAAGDFWPSAFHPGNYAEIWDTVELGAGLSNSVLVAGSVAVVSALVSVATAYVLVRFRFLGRGLILRGLLALQSIPGTLMLLPVFVLFANLSRILSIDTIGTRWALFVTYLTFALPFSTWVMVTYLRGLPAELDEAARLDGASSWRILRSIVIPLSWPGLVVSAIFAFLLGWNDVLFASVITDADTRTAAVALQVFGATQEGGAVPLYGQLMASALVCALPVVVLYLAFQRFLVGGLTAGGVK